MQTIKIIDDQWAKILPVFCACHRQFLAAVLGGTHSDAYPRHPTASGTAATIALPSSVVSSWFWWVRLKYWSQPDACAAKLGRTANPSIQPDKALAWIQGLQAILCSLRIRPDLEHLFNSIVLRDPPCRPGGRCHVCTMSIWTKSVTCLNALSISWSTTGAVLRALRSCARTIWDLSFWSTQLFG